jgi:hypothetical protein
MRTYRVALVAAIMTAIAMTVSSTASAEMRVFGKVQQAMVENSYWDHNHGHGLVPTDWQANHCTHAWEATVIWGWGAWEYWVAATLDAWLCFTHLMRLSGPSS